MTVDQHMFCKNLLQDVRDELLWMRHRDPDRFAPLIRKLEDVYKVLMERSFVRHVAAHECTDAAVDYERRIAM
jgi:hypothetical protein